jgi:ribosomal protein S18 acetylase RimI-like enzyme
VLRRPAGDADQAFLVALYAETRADEMAHTGWPAHQVEQFLRFQFEAQQADYQRRFPTAEHSIVTVDEVPVGRIWVDRGPAETRLLDVTITRRRRGQGIGTRLLTDLQCEAYLAGRPIRLTVLTTNRSALRLYRRLGFTIVGEHLTHHLMEWSGPLDQTTDANTAS